MTTVKVETIIALEKALMRPDAMWTLMDASHILQTINCVSDMYSNHQ